MIAPSRLLHHALNPLNAIVMRPSRSASVRCDARRASVPTLSRMEAIDLCDGIDRGLPALTSDPATLDVPPEEVKPGVYVHDCRLVDRQA